jgi:NAD dependent epimerase/dehydratase family.
MVIGNGMIGKKFAPYRLNDAFVIFASGVSNSKTIDDSAYQREKELLQSVIQENTDKTLVYFSTCSIYDPDEQTSKYVLHKKNLEALIQKKCNQFHIFRVSNLVGISDNPNTILNFFIQHFKHKINFDLWSNAARNLLDIDDMYRIVDHILQNRLYLCKVLNIASPVTYSVKEIIAAIESLWNIKANYIPIEKGSRFIVDITAITPIIRELGIRFENDYLTILLKKYYSHQ